MTDTRLDRLLCYGTAAERGAFTPDPPPGVLVLFYEEDTGDMFLWDTDAGPAAWIALPGGGGSGITALTGDVTASGSGSVAATLATPLTPGGRLTLTSNTPVMIADATAQTSVYYAPYVHARVPIYSGSVWAMKAFAQLTMALDTSNQLAEKLYDFYIWNDAGTLKIGCGPAWINTATITVTIATPAVVSWASHGLPEGAPVVFTTSGALPTGITAGTTYYVGRSPAANTFNISTTKANAAAGTFVATSGSQSGTHTGTNGTTVRGTGAGTTELELKDGIWTNKNAITLTNGAGAGTAGIAANTATYVGTACMTANGQTGMAFNPAAAGGGTNNILGLWNAYNRVRIAALNRDSTASWAYSTSTWRAENGNVANRISFVDGLALSPVFAAASALQTAAATGAIGTVRDSTTGTPNATAQCSAVAGTGYNTSQADSWNPALGFHYLQQMEEAFGACTFNGAQSGGRQTCSLTVQLDM